MMTNIRAQVLVDNILSRWVWESSVSNPSYTRKALKEWIERGVKSNSLILALKELLSIPPDEGQNYVVIASARELLEIISKE